MVGKVPIKLPKLKRKMSGELNASDDVGNVGVRTGSGRTKKPKVCLCYKEFIISISIHMIDSFSRTFLIHLTTTKKKIRILNNQRKFLKSNFFLKVQQKHFQNQLLKHLPANYSNIALLLLNHVLCVKNSNQLLTKQSSELVVFVVD